jgi:GAF domain-containing protein
VRFRGKFGSNQTLELELFRNGDQLSGRYLSKDRWESGSIVGSIDERDNVELREVANGNTYSRFSARLIDGRRLEGRWIVVGESEPRLFAVIADEPLASKQEVARQESSDSKAQQGGTAPQQTSGANIGGPDVNEPKAPLSNQITPARENIVEKDKDNARVRSPFVEKIYEVGSNLTLTGAIVFLGALVFWPRTWYPRPDGRFRTGYKNNREPVPPSPARVRFFNWVAGCALLVAMCGLAVMGVTDALR